jgi:hypothetical protein
VIIKNAGKHWKKNNTYGKVQMTNPRVKNLCNILHDVVCKLVILTSRVVYLRTAFCKAGSLAV